MMIYNNSTLDADVLDKLYSVRNQLEFTDDPVFARMIEEANRLVYRVIGEFTPLPDCWHATEWQDNGGLPAYWVAPSMNEFSIAGFRIDGIMHHVLSVPVWQAIGVPEDADDLDSLEWEERDEPWIFIYREPV